MATQGGEVREGRLEREGAGLLQQGEPRETGAEGSSARGRQTPRLLLRPYGGHEEEADKHEDRKRPRFED